MKNKQHYFNVELATKIGVEKAVLMANIEYWLDWSKSHGKNEKDGYHWTYNSAEGFSKLFPYMSKHTIGRHLKALEADGYLITGVFNKAGYDRTKWYTTSDYKILQNCKMELAELQNGTCRIATPIPYINTDSKPDSKQKDFAQSDDFAVLVEQGFSIFYSAGLVKKSKKTAFDKFKLLVKKTKADPIEIGELLKTDIKSRIANQQFGIDKLHPATYLNQQRWEDDHETNNNRFNAQPRKLSASERIAKRNAERYGSPERGLRVAEDGGYIRGAVDQGEFGRTFENVDISPEQAINASDQDRDSADS